MKGARFSVALAAALFLGSVPLATDAPLADAAMRNEEARVAALLEEGANPDQAQGDGMTALHWAAAHGNGRMASMLLESGASPSPGTRIGAYQPLHLAAKAGAAEVVELLLSYGADPSAPLQSSGGARPLHFAAESGSPEAVSALLDAGADPNAREASWGQTPLVFAASKGRAEAISVLLKAGADPGATTRVIELSERAVGDRIERSLRNQAIKEGRPWDPGEARRLREEALAQRADSANRMLAERQSAEDGESRVVEEPEPLSYADLVGGHGGMTALLHAAREGHGKAVRALLEGGARIDQPSAGDGTTPLLISLINGRFDLALFMLEAGADPGRASDAGATPLYVALNTHWAPKSRYPQQHAYMQQNATYLDVMRALLEAGADPNARLERHLWYMSYNFDLLQVDTKGATPFWRAAYALDVEAMKLLVEFGADPSIPTQKVPKRRYSASGGEKPDPSGLPPVPLGGPGVYPIHAASGVGYGQGFAGNAHRHVPGGWLAAVRFLVEEAGADVNARDLDGYAPLHHAAARGDNELIRYLADQGADPLVVSRAGQTTVDMANGPVQRIQPFPETIMLLESMGAVNNHNCVSC